MTKTIGLFGGTFNPVHRGHLTMALELKRHLGLDEMRLLPAHIPPHRSAPCVSSLHRLAMVELAVQELALDDGESLLVDDRELCRSTTSYTVDTLLELHAEFESEPLADQTSLVLCMGLDSLLSLPTWHRWEEILSLANIAVVARPGWTMPKQGLVSELLKLRQVSGSELAKQRSGAIVIETLSLLDISATAVREKLALAADVDNMLPKAVCRYIQEHELYRGL